MHNTGIGLVTSCIVGWVGKVMRILEEMCVLKRARGWGLQFFLYTLSDLGVSFERKVGGRGTPHFKGLYLNGVRLF